MDKEPYVSLASRIKYLEAQYGGLRRLARLLSMDAAYLLRLKTGEKKNPSNFILEKLGLKRRTFYVLRQSGQDGGKMGKGKYDPLTPDLTTLCKLGSIVVHVEEMLSTGHAFDRAALQSLLIDPEVQRWIKAMGVYVPLKR